MRQGEVYELVEADARYRVVIVSSDAHNAVRAPWVVPVRHGTLDAPPYRVALVDADPLGGSVDLDRLARATPNGSPLGMITGATMQRVRQAIYTLFSS